MPRLKTPDPLAKAIGRRVLELLAERRLTQERLAFENDVPKATIANLARGLARPSIVTLKKIADGLDVELLDLFTRPRDSERHRVVNLTRNASASTLRAVAAILARDQAEHRRS
jgi:transcriptional regulator with XRE-family HTH domain